MAMILLLGDYLDMPLLCYESRHRIIQELVDVVVSVERQLAFNYILRLKQAPFVRAADILHDSGTILGEELAQGIKDLFKDLEGVHNLRRAIEGFMRAFPDEDWMLEDHYWRLANDSEA